MRSILGWALITLAAGVPLRAADTPAEVRLTILIENPGDTTLVRIPLSWMEVALDILQVLDRDRVDTSDTLINLEALKAALRSFRGGFLEILGDSERVSMYMGSPDIRCPCLDITDRKRQGHAQVRVNLEVARHVLQSSEIGDLSREERDRLLRFLDHPRPGEPIEIVNTRGDTVYLRIVARPGEAKQSGPGSTLSRNQNTMRKGVGHSENHERSFR